MTTTSPSDLVLTGPRLSSLAMCERRPVFEYLDADRDPVPPDQARRLRRGRAIGRLMAEEVAATLAGEGKRVEAERPVPWGIDGEFTGHADLFVHPDGLTIEVVSTKDADLPLYKVRQVSLYSILDPESRGAGVLSIDPSTYAERWYEVDVETYRPGLEQSVRRVLAAMKARDPGAARRALDASGEFEVDTPSGFPCWDCPFKRACWEDWEPPARGQLPSSLHAVVVELAMVEDKLASLRRSDHLEERREELRERLAGHLEPGVDYTAPGFRKIRVTEVAGRRSFSLSAFEKAGHRLPAVAEQFVTVGRGHLRWTIQREQAS